MTEKTFRPKDRDTLVARIAACHRDGAAIGDVDLGKLNALVEHTAADMTAVVECGLTLSKFQSALKKQGQWLPIDPPGAASLTIAELLDQNLFGSRRHAYGTIREHLIGLTVVMGDSGLVKSGGKVVKNVAGFDLCKLFIGAQGTLGIIVEAAFKLRPIAPVEVVTSLNCPSLRDAELMIERIQGLMLSPVLFDVCKTSSKNQSVGIQLGFAGSKVEVDSQMELVTPLGFSLAKQEGLHEFVDQKESKGFQRSPVLPSKMFHYLECLCESVFVGNVGTGVIWHVDEIETPKTKIPTALLNRTKQRFDPKGVFPALKV
jgi:hypothetical protein